MKIALAAALLLCVPFLSFRADEDRTAVERAATNYVEAIYSCKPELIERSVDAELHKLGTYRPADADDYGPFQPMTYDQLVRIAERWNADGKRGDDLEFEVEILDLLDRTASVKLTADWGIDYMHLIKQGKTWKIRQILWQSHPPAQ